MPPERRCSIYGFATCAYTMLENMLFKIIPSGQTATRDVRLSLKTRNAIKGVMIVVVKKISHTLKVLN